MNLSSEAIIAQALSNAPKSTLARHPQLRYALLTIYVLWSLFLLPLWALLYVPTSRRPRPSWSLWRSLRIQFKRRMCSVVAWCEMDHLGRDLSIEIDSATLTHSKPITIPPAPLAYLRGHPMEMLGYLMHNIGQWTPPLIHRDERNNESWTKWNERRTTLGFAPVKAFWYTKKSALDNVILNFHGGGYICGTAAETDLTSAIPKNMLRSIDNILSVDYRLAPEAPWPLPLLDAISAYRYLVKSGARNVIVMGDSAGAHLALALMRYIQDEGTAVGLPRPRALILASPWADIGFTSAWGDGLYHNAHCDIIDDTFGPFATSLLVRAIPHELMHTSPYLSPAGLLAEDWSFAAFPPVFILAGGAERLSLSIRLLWERIRKSRAERDQFLEIPDAIHDFLIFPWMKKESEIAYREIDNWLRDLLCLPTPCEPKPLKSPLIRAISHTQRRLMESEHSLSSLPPLEL